MKPEEFGPLDLFAAFALVGILIQEKLRSTIDKEDCSRRSALAYAQARAMLDERNRK